MGVRVSLVTTIYKFESKVGPIYIKLQDGHWHVIHDDENLGSYATAQLALDDLVGGHTYWPSSGVDPSTLGISDDFEDWVAEA